MPEDVYRQAASMIVLRPTEVCKPGGECETLYQLLLLHKPRKRDAWQLPQGGVEAGETTQQAALRELKEESGLGHATVLGQSKRVYQYDFPASFRRFRPDNVCGQQIGYVFATVSQGAHVQVDEKEIDSHVWIDISQLPQYIKRKEYLTMVVELYEEALCEAKKFEQ